MNRDAALRRAASALVAAGTALQDAAQALAEATGEERPRPGRKPRKAPVFEPPPPEAPSELHMAKARELLRRRGVSAA